MLKVDIGWFDRRARQSINRCEKTFKHWRKDAATAPAKMAPQKRTRERQRNEGPL